LSTLWNEVYVGREEVVRGLESYAWSKPYAGLFAEGYDPHSDIKKD